MTDDQTNSEGHAASMTGQHDKGDDTQREIEKNGPSNLNTSSDTEGGSLGNCSSSEKPDQANIQEHALLDAACTATRMTVLGYLPKAKRNENGSVKLINGEVMFEPAFDRRRERSSSWTDDIALRLVHALPSHKHARFLAAVQAMVNPFDFADCKPLGSWNPDGTFEPDGDDLMPDECRYTVPTLCMRVADLSFENARRFLHPSADLLRGRLANDATRDGKPFDGEVAGQLHVEVFTEDEFNDVVEWFAGIGLLHAADAPNGTRPASVNTLSMAQCTPTMKPTLLQGAPVQGVVAPLKTKRDGFNSTGDEQAETKETPNGVTYLRRRNKELVAEKRKMRSQRDEARNERDEARGSSKRKSELIELQEERHAKEHYKLSNQRDDALAKLDALSRVFEEGMAIIRGDDTPQQKVDALGSVFVASEKEHVTTKSSRRAAR